SHAGESAYVVAADTNRDGVLDAVDVQILGSNFGFTANRPPVVTPATVRTHVDMEVAIPLASLAADPGRDGVVFRIVSSQNGTSHLSGDGQSVLFVPAAGFSGQAGFQVIADDGFSSSAAATVPVSVSDAALVGLDFVKRNPRLQSTQTTRLQVLGDFADQ